VQLYFRGPWVKLELAVGRGRKLHDKRAAIREREDRREADRAIRRG
jgi:SsrA-binding protein